MIWVTVCDYCRCVQCLLVSNIDMLSLQPCVRWWRSCRRTGRLHAVWEALPISATASCFYRVMSGRNALIESITNCWLPFLYRNVNELEKTYLYLPIPHLQNATKSSCHYKIPQYFWRRIWKCNWKLSRHTTNNLLIFTNQNAIV